MLDSCTGRRVRYCASIATRGTSSCSSTDAISVNRCVVFRAGCRSSARCRIASPLTPSGSSEILTLCSIFTGSAGGTPLTPFLLAEPFHREFATQAFHQGWLRLWFLEIDGKPVAALHGFRFAGADSAYQAGRDPAFRQQPVGFVLLAHAVREALTRRDGRVPPPPRWCGLQGAIRHRRPGSRDIRPTARRLSPVAPHGRARGERALARRTADSGPALVHEDGGSAGFSRIWSFPTRSRTRSAS